MGNPAAPIPSISPQPAVSLPAESPHRRWILWSAIGLTFLTLGIALGLLGAKFLNKSQSQSQLPTSSSAQSPTLTLAPIVSPEPAAEADDPTADWKTYTNTKHSYSIKLPQDWQPDRGYPGGQYSDEQLQTLDSTTWFKNSSIFSVQALFDCSSVADICFKKHQSDADKMGGPYTTKNTTTETSSYLGQSAIIARSSYKTNFTVKGVFMVQRGKLWMFETQSIDETIEKETDQILSTFHFLK